ncbi:hypothetical protein RFI_12238 [Reticulomyxa filosa]|uniref:Uncharacterized protein n=1 Tax=Reticulomyxa filosa TaxID=46433 RepID=X6NG41_RETFI|nr:hypothetical protein RFI_12238 [Reticulomyxa filosa]|eukprot:ETO24921.1 hypothetical protein RFI_12238 [Reticulomyxa filosa]
MKRTIKKESEKQKKTQQSNSCFANHKNNIQINKSHISLIRTEKNSTFDNNIPVNCKNLGKKNNQKFYSSLSFTFSLSFSSLPFLQCLEGKLVQKTKSKKAVTSLFQHVMLVTEEEAKKKKKKKKKKFFFKKKEKKNKKFSTNTKKIYF